MCYLLIQNYNHLLLTIKLTLFESQNSNIEWGLHFTSLNHMKINYKISFYFCYFCFSLCGLQLYSYQIKLKNNQGRPYNTIFVKQFIITVFILIKYWIRLMFKKLNTVSMFEIKIIIILVDIVYTDKIIFRSSVIGK